MPTLRRLVDNGVGGNVASLQPMLSPMLWNSIATGKMPSRHGVHGFTEPCPDGSGVRPVSSTSRKCKAVWNILSQVGLKSNVLGWFASHPAEPINGVMVSNRYQRFNHDSPTGAQGELSAGTIHPERLTETLAALRVGVDELDDQVLLPFVPLAAEIDQRRDRKLYQLSVLLAECFSLQAAAIHLIRTEPWDFTAVYFDTIDRVCHAFMQFHPPRMPHVDEKLYRLYSQVVTGIYRLHDMMLDGMLAQAPPDTTVMVVSDHGYHADYFRPYEAPGRPANPVASHRHYGMLCMHGPGLGRATRLYGASVLDITPTILAMFGLPLGADMAGRPLVEAFESPPELERVVSWDSIEGASGQHPQDLREDPAQAYETLQHLADLGYITAPKADKQDTIQDTLLSNQYQLALSLLHERKQAEALALVEELLTRLPDNPRYLMLAARCHHQLGQRGQCRHYVERTLDKMEDSAEARLLQAKLEFGDGHVEAALELLAELERSHPRLPGLQLEIGRVYLRRRRWSEAEHAFGAVLDRDPDSAHAHEGLAAAYLGQRRDEEAANEALTSIELLRHYPRAHYRLGIALARLKRYRQAIEAFEMVLSMMPGLCNAHRWLTRLFAREGNSRMSDFHRLIAQDLMARRSSVA